MVLKSLILILSAQRHSTTTLCEYINNIDKTVSCPKNEVLAHWHINYEYESPLQKLDNIIDNLDNNISIYCLKIMSQDVNQYSNDVNQYIKYIEEIIKKYKTIVKIIVLTRKLEDSYKSLCKSLTTGNWGTTPEKQEYHKNNNIIHYIAPQLIVPFEEYVITTNKWFTSINNLTEKYHLNVLHLKFEQVISNDLDIVNNFLGFYQN